MKVKEVLTLDSRSQAINESLIYREVQVADASFLVPSWSNWDIQSIQQY